MSGAAGAGASGPGNGVRGSATHQAEAGGTASAGGGRTVTDTREPDSLGAQPYPGTQGGGRQYQGYDQYEAGPLPGERPGADAGPAQPYTPPQAYPTPEQPGVRRPRTGARTQPRTRKARLRVAKADPWSVMKVSFLLSIALGICTIVAAAVLWMVMDAMGVFSTVGGTISEATGSSESNGFDLQSFLSLPRVLMFTSIIAVIDVVLATALATLGAFIYNLSAGFVGGVELTLAEDE
ncbi:hypothetical protein EES44_00900 [Streptomyces sp. ADI96-15]|uniref:DUF3566 domain-containing protein n=1 Tax=Streptomyces albidoflavus TaxID=1886 RepID=UPI000FAF08C6|nr:DUF3566 domain-containing protein [Streptomyces sp. ADI96-15]RPK76102.1 hypothetical protein EES44_00900 [Streptomyces sp. ADI96-15]